MKCPHCKVEVASNTVYCGQCGGKLDGEQAPDPLLVEARRQGPPPLTEDDPRTRFTNMAAARQDPRPAEPENQVWTGSYSKRAMIGAWIAGTAVSILVPIIAAMVGMGGTGWLWLCLAILLMWLVLAGRYFYRRLSVQYTLTSQRFMHESGLLWRRTDRIELIDIDDVTFKQGPVERMMNVGVIHITSSDKTDPEIDLPGIEDVKRVAGMIDDLRRKERYKRGLHIESL